MVTEIANRENSYQLAFRALQEGRESESVSWLRRLRANAMDQFSELGFPSVKNEEWKYTNVAPIAAIDFKPARLQTTTESEIETEELAPFRWVETAQSELVFLNGRLRKDLSSWSAIPEEVVAMDLSEAIADERYCEIAWKYLAQQADYVADGFTALNTALVSHGAFVYLPKNTVMKTPLHLLFISDGTQTANFPRVLVVAGENSSATLIESFGSLSDSSYF